MGQRIERFDVVVIGAGQAGLAAGYWLAQQDIDFIILDANARVGDSWRRRWDSLRLFTPARYSSLPGLDFPGDPYHLPVKDEVADYLEWYARVFDLPVRNNVRITSVERLDGYYDIIAANGHRYQADNVIVASGPFHVPRIPAIAKELDPAIVQLHSSAYANPSQLPEGDTLVVGAANSGAQIALELAQTRGTLLAGRSVGSLPRRLLGRDLFDWLGPTLRRFGAHTRIGARMRADVTSSTDKLIGMAERDLVHGGVQRVPRVVGARDGQPVFADGSSVNVRSVIWATGFRPDFRWIELPVFDGSGFPRHERGVVREAPGLFFVGLRFQYRLNSSLVGGVGADAEYVVQAVMDRYGDARVESSLDFPWGRAASY
jgi:putative flavoprotein involved in K+ transport